MEQVYHAERIFDGEHWHAEAALVVRDGRVAAILPGAEAPGGQRLAGWIAPGLVDLQVNGGGGVLFNNDPTPAGIAAICDAHARLGTTSTMVTLITDTPEVTDRAIAAARAATVTPGFLGLHLEGPHLDPARKGTHDPALIRPMEVKDLARLTAAARALPHLICTLAPEAASPAQVSALAEAGAVVSLGHSDCTFAVAMEYLQAGARMVTHLFNAMSQMQHRAPGLVGVALTRTQVMAGLIADGFHVDDVVMDIALRARPEGLFLVSDAMSTIGSDQTEFTLNGRRIYRGGGRLTLADGTLAGADIALIDAVRHLHGALGLPAGQCLALAGAAPARALGVADRGHLRQGARGDFLLLSPLLELRGVWIGGAAL